MNYIVAFLFLLALYEKRTECVNSVYKGRIPRQLSNNLPSTIEEFENITIENSTETTTSFPDDNDITDNFQYILELFDKNKLPPSIVPKDYIINLVTDSKNLKFYGDVTIYGTPHNAIENKKVITMNSDAINVTDVDVIDLKSNTSIVKSFKLLSASEHLVIELNEELQSKTDYIISMKFFGEIRSENGIYVSTFYNDTTKTQSNPIIMTEFQPTYARTVFPCWDEPQYKASFTVRVARELNETALSNMPVVHTTEPDPNENGKVWDTFQKSPVMSTYLVAVVIGELGVLKDPEGSNISIWTQPGKEETGTYALNLTKTIVEVLEKFTESDYILPKLDQVALPALDFDAMENWGVISYMDSYLLVDDKNSIEQKQKVAYHVTHEVAHQWFGNLITLEWWDSVWLNEGFAQFFQYFILDSLEPEWRTMDSFVVTELQYILDVDSNTKTHSLTETDIDSTDDILSMFDGTSYFKGGAIVRMLYHMVTPDLFQKSIAKYIEVNKLESVTEEDLWDSFREVVSTKLDLPADISELMYNWVHKNGYPVIHVERSVNDSGPVHSVTLTQNWFLKKRDKYHLDDLSELKWWIPLTYTTSTDLDFEDTKPKEWFNPTSDKHNLSIYLEEDEWFILNTQLTGFYRVNYDELTWKLIIDDMVDYGFYDIHPINRAVLLNDAFNLALTGYIDIEIPMNLSRYLFRETDIIPWTTASAIFTKLAKGLTSTPARPLFMKYARSLISSCWFSEIELDENENDTIATKLNRMLLIQVACSFQHKGCQAKALNQVFLMMSEADLVIPSDLESLYLSIGVALGPDEVWQYVRKRYIKSNNKIERRMLLDAMACNDDNTILEQMLKDSIDSESFLLKQDRGYLIDGIISQMHPSELNIILKFFSENFDELLNLHGEPKVKSFFLRMAMRSNKTQTEKIHEMLLEHSDKLDTTFLLIEGKKNNEHFEIKPAIYNKLYEWLQREEIDSENDNENETNDSNEDEDFDFDDIEITTDIIVVEENTTLDYDISNTTEEISTTTEYFTESNELLNKIKIGGKNLTDYVHKKVDVILENKNELLNKITPLRPTIKPDNSSANNVKTDYLYIFILILLLYLNVLFIVNC